MWIQFRRLGLLAGCTAVLAMQVTSADAEAPRTRAPGRMGTLISAEPIEAPPDAQAAYRILYRSSDSKGRPVMVSGLIALPNGPAPAHGRPIVSWGHGTTGVADDCAPSRRPQRAFAAITGLHALLRQGDVVVATDYLGLGTPGVHPYLDGDSAARSMIDAVRAARHLPDSHGGARFAALGFSQGGHATLSVAADAAAYAPELDLVGVAAASAPTELRPLFQADAGSRAGEVIASYAMSSWAKFYRAPIDAVIKPEAKPVLAKIASTCSLSDGDDLILGLDTFGYDNTGFLKKDADKQKTWSRLIDRNSAPMPRRGVPVFLAQGSRDQIVEASVTRDYARLLCATGRRVNYVEV
ncbi:MAG TPA: lipase family protein, partial [Ancylobacter sp.]